MTASEHSDGVSEPSGNAEKGPSAAARANLRLLDALLNAEANAASFAALFQALRAAFAFDRAMVLQDEGEWLRCVASEPRESIGRQWAAEPLLRAVARGRVLSVTGEPPSPDRDQLPNGLIEPDASALLLPFAVGDHHAALVLLRNIGQADFNDEELVAARQCGIIALALVAMRSNERLASDVEQLRRLADDLWQAEQNASRDRDLLQEIIDLLPIGLTVQDDDGRFILVNAVAAANLSTPVEALLGRSPADFLPGEEAAQRRQWELGVLRTGRTVTTEERCADERTLLTSHTPVRILDRTFLMSSSSDITERKHFEDELARRAYFDDLTGLPNRALVEQRVEEVLRLEGASARFALAFIDLDNFKYINDYYSHAIGDALLVKVADRIRKSLRETDMLARISGDEFLLLITPVENEDFIRAIVGRLLANLKQPFHIEAYEVFTSASLGVSVYPEHGTSYEALRRNADNAMYRAKNGTKGEAIYFDVNMGQSITARMELEQRLRLAIRDRRFCCAFQPKVDIHSQEVVGFETLVRWKDDDGEIQPPSTFIDLAIELGLIDPITHFVLEETVRSLARLDEAFGAGTTISINVAAKQASDLNFMRSFIQALDASHFARRIMLELTEDAFVAKSQFQTQVLPMVRELGVRVSIDDFGTGYSSLSTLADITADELKVDRSFITAIHQRPRSQSVLRTIESLGHSLGMTIVAEGIETFEELAYLQAATRIRQGQGYYFSRPFFIEDLDSHCIGPDIRTPEVMRPQVERRRPLPARGAGA